MFQRDIANRLAVVEHQITAHEKLCDEIRDDFKKAVQILHDRISKLPDDLRADRQADMASLREALKESTGSWRKVVYGCAATLILGEAGIIGWLIVRFVIGGGS